MNTGGKRVFNRIRIIHSKPEALLIHCELYYANYECSLSMGIMFAALVS